MLIHIWRNMSWRFQLPAYALNDDKRMGNKRDETVVHKGDPINWSFKWDVVCIIRGHFQLTTLTITLTT